MNIHKPKPGDPKTAATRETESSLGSALVRRLGFGSIRGRYLFVAGFFVFFILAAGWAAQNIVNQSAQRSSVNVSEREQINRLLNELSNDIWLTETALQGYLLTPGKLQRSSTLTALDRLIADTGSLSATDWVQYSSARHEKLQRLQGTMQELHRHSERLLDIRADAEQLFPAMRHMLDKMLPNNIQFLTSANLAIDEAEARREMPSQDEIRWLFSEARYAWVTMVGNFRVFVANRFGVFPGDSESNMKNQHQRIEFYHEMVTRQLASLAQFEARQVLEFQQTESLAQMRISSQEWRQAYLATAAIYSSERWRADVPLLRDTIRPLFNQVWAELGVLRGEIDSAAVTDMTSVTTITDRLSGALWVISFITIVLTAAGYLLFEYTVRRPIANVALALKAEARGEKAVSMRRPNTHEIRDLVEAFDHMRAEVHSREERLQTILDNTAEGIITFDAQGGIEGYNHAAKRLFGWAEREVAGQGVHVLVQRDLQAVPESYLSRFLRHEFDTLLGQEGEVTGQRKGGDNFPMAIKLGAMQLHGKRLYTALVADISERQAMVERLRARAEHDDLTGLYNRSFFLQEIERVVERARRSHLVSTLLYIDLDNFKYVNDTLGHLAGDRLLIEVGTLLRKRARRSDLIARLGGDEFTMLLYDTHTDEAQVIAESFRKALAEYRFRHSGDQLDMGCSIGVATITATTRSPQEVLSHADFACHLAKREGRNRVHVFERRDEANVAAMSLDMGWSRRIKDAIGQNQFVLVAQPVVDTRSKRVAAYEVLLRLLDERGEFIMPNGFLPSAERFGLATEIDRWVIVHALQALSTLVEKNPGLRFSINLSGQTLSEPDVCSLIIAELRRCKLDPSMLTFEVTETAAIANMLQAETFLGKLKEIGCSTALDDFGAGMSSFAYLRELPVDFVKIDGRFVRNMAANIVDQAMVRAMNDIAHALGKRTIAEFVEDEECFRLLCEYGVDYAQGLYLGRPDLISTLAADKPSVNADRRIVYLKPR